MKPKKMKSFIEIITTTTFAYDLQNNWKYLVTAADRTQLLIVFLIEESPTCNHRALGRIGRWSHIPEKRGRERERERKCESER